MSYMRIENRNRERVELAPLPSGGTLIFFVGVLLWATMLLTLTLTADLRAEPISSNVTPTTGTPEMTLIAAGEFAMGNDGAYADEMPIHQVHVSAFYMDQHEVTNAQFAAFVQATGHVTAAERDGHCWSYVDGDTDWQYAAATDWRHPQGPESSASELWDHPVVCVTWADAAAYARWAGKRLPTEAEWEYAARAGSPGHFIARTDGGNHDHGHHELGAQELSIADRSPSSKSHTSAVAHRTSDDQHYAATIAANVWQGHWPEVNKLDDGFYYTAPAATFAANDMGVHDMLGNVWEWTADWYDSSYYAISPIRNPQGPATGTTRVARGGSWFCSPNYCGAYSTHYRGASPPDHAFNNVGFRCARDVATVTE